MFLSTIAIFTGCCLRDYKKNLSEELSNHIKILQEDQPVIEGVHIFNTDVIIKLFEKDEKLLSAKWESWENVDQLIFAIRKSYLEGLQPEDYHLEAIENLAVLQTDGSEVNPASIDWNNVTSGNFPYRIRQDPGPINALGKVKFMFPNKYNVYIHDTPSRKLFSHTYPL